MSRSRMFVSIILAAGLTGCHALSPPAGSSPVLVATMQAPALPGAPALSSRDRVYTADQVSNTVSVIDPATNSLLGTIALGDPRPNVLGANYRRQVSVHGLGFSPDGRWLAAVSVTSNGVTLIETATNRVRGTVYVGRTRRIVTSDGVAMVVFSADGKFAFVNSSRTAELAVVDVAAHTVIKRLPLPSTFSPNLAASPDGQEVWVTLKDVGKVVIVDARALEVLGTIDTGPVTNHVNFVTTPTERLAYVTIGGENNVKVYRRNGATPALIATIPVGDTPHGLWPSADNSTVYVGEENADSVAVIDVASQRVRARIAVGQAPQALVYVANAVPSGSGREGLTRQHVGLRIERRALTVPGAAGAAGKAVLRSLGQLDAVEIALRGLPAGGMYDVYAVQRRAAPYGRAVKLAHLMATAAGTAEAAAQLEFFASGFNTVVVVPAGEMPSGATLSGLPVPVMRVAAANHCSMH